MATKLKIKGMTCASCVSSIESRLKSLPGVYSASVSLLAESAFVKYNESVITPQDISQAVDDMGFDVMNVIEESHQDLWKKRFIQCLFFAIPEFIIMMAMFPFLNVEIFRGLTIQNILEVFLTTPVQFGVGSVFYRKAYMAIRHGSFTMDLLIVIGTSSAYFYSWVSIVFTFVGITDHSITFFETCTTLLTFITLGKYLENKAKHRTCDELDHLIKLRPNRSRRVFVEEDGNRNEENIETSRVSLGDVVKVLPGESVPVDGIVLEGSSYLNEAMITGESELVSKKEGSSVYAGTLNTNGVILVETTGSGSQTVLSKIVNLMENAQTQKPKIQRYADVIASYFVPAVLLLGVLTFIGWFVILSRNPNFISHDGIFITSLKMSISVIVFACPCALGLATPTAIMVGTGVAAKHGILIKDTNSFEESQNAKTIIFDKTGTLTEGNLSVKKRFFVDYPDELVLTLIGALEMNSEHPIGKAIVEYCKNVLDCHRFDAHVSNISVMPGKGISGDICLFSDQKVYTVQLINSAEIPFEIDSIRSDEEEFGRTVVLVEINQEIIGLISLCDNVRKESRSVIRKLKQKGYSIIMATGDSRATAESIAKQVGIDRVFSQMTPNDKFDLVKKIQATEKVVMIGDGINDSPSIKLANIGVCVYNGSDVAVEAASIVLMKNNLANLVTALDICNLTLRRIRLNFIWASAYNIVGLPIAAGILSPIGITLSPIISGSLMAFSSVSVVVSSLLLKNFRPEKIEKFHFVPTQEFKPEMKAPGKIAMSRSTFELFNFNMVAREKARENEYIPLV